MPKNENEEEKKPMMAAELIDHEGQKRYVLFSVNARKKFIECVERELRKRGVVPERIQKYLVFFGKIDLKDKNFQYLSRKPKKPMKDSRNKTYRRFNECIG